MHESVAHARRPSRATVLTGRTCATYKKFHVAEASRSPAVTMMVTLLSNEFKLSMVLTSSFPRRTGESDTLQRLHLRSRGSSIMVEMRRLTRNGQSARLTPSLISLPSSEPASCACGPIWNVFWPPLGRSPCNQHPCGVAQ